jgi:LysM repeat protein
MKIKVPLFVKLLILAPIILGIYTIPVQASLLNAPTPYDLIAAVNALRASNGLPPLRTDSSLMTAAQSQSDYQASIGTWSHTGQNGSTPTQRDIAAGYGHSIITSENVAELISSLPIDTLINTVWSDSLHMATMLSTSATDMGAGVTEKDGYVFYTLDVSYIASHPAKIVKSFPTPTPAVIATKNSAATSVTMTPSDPTSSPVNTQPVQTVTPQDIGIVVHVVQPGDSLYSIAVSYKTTISDIKARNGIADNNDVIYVDQKLLIRVVLTPTASPVPTNTEPSSTPTLAATNISATPTMTITPLSTFTSTTAPTFTLTAIPLQPTTPSNESTQPQPIGITLVIIGGLAVAGAMGFYFLRKK